jgi:hypothetical protein
MSAIAYRCRACGTYETRCSCAKSDRDWESNIPYFNDARPMMGTRELSDKDREIIEKYGHAFTERKPGDFTITAMSDRDQQDGPPSCVACGRGQAGDKHTCQQDECPKAVYCLPESCGDCPHDQQDEQATPITADAPKTARRAAAPSGWHHQRGRAIHDLPLVRAAITALCRLASARRRGLPATPARGLIADIREGSQTFERGEHE